MPSLRGNPFSTSSRYTLGSNATTDRNQGGGSKKAGFPYQIGRDHWSNIFLNTCDPTSVATCCKLSQYNTTLVFTKNTVRPINSDSRIPMR